MKNKETLEEAKICAVNKWVEGYNHLKLSDFEKNGVAVDFGNGWDEAIKWQAERMYSEEELQQKINAHLEVAKDLWLSAIKEQKRMYSEEEVVNILIKAYEDIGKRKIPNQVVLASWFKQFKKK